jgi:hypothetical protein
MYVCTYVCVGVEEAIAITMNLAVIDDITQLPAEATVSQLDLPASICQPRLWMIVCCALMLPPTAHCPCAATKSSLWFGYLRAGGGAPRIGVRLGWYGSRDQVIAADGQPGGHRIQHYTADLPDAWVRCCYGLHATLPCPALPV